MSNLAKKTAQEIRDYQAEYVQIVPGLLWNQYLTINQIYFYYNSKFQSGDTDDEGDRKYFYNINKNPCKVFSKAIDFDTKNIRLLTVGGGDPTKTWFMERDLKYWMRDKQFGKTLNRIFRELPIFGTVVLKILNGTPYFVDLRNFVVEQTADSLDQMSFKTEIHYLTVAEFKKIAKRMKWKQSDVDEVVKKFREARKASRIVLWERYGDVEDDNGNYSYKRSFIADVEWNIYDINGTKIGTERGVVLSSEDWKPEEDPYWEIHAEKMAGRWLGIGVVEALFEPQIRENELCNIQSKTTYWAGLRIFQTRDNTVNRNFMTDVRNGEVINADSEITQISMEDRNLAFFNEEHQKWMSNRDELTFSYDVVQGERLPSGTPLGSAQLAASQTLSYFEQIQENVALDIKEMLYEEIIPYFERSSSPEHVLRLVGNDLEEYIGMVKNELVFEEMIRQIMNGANPSEEMKNTIQMGVEASMRLGKEKLLTIPTGFYEGVKYDVDIDITGESVDTRVRYATRFAILQAITSDPTMTTDPIKKKILAGMAEDGGINPTDLFGVDDKSQAPQQQAPVPGRAGGGVSAASLGANIPGAATSTV